MKRTCSALATKKAQIKTQGQLRERSDLEGRNNLNLTTIDNQIFVMLLKLTTPWTFKSSTTHFTISQKAKVKT